MKLISRGIVAILVVLCIAFVNTVAPANAYAEALNQLGNASTHSVSTVVEGNGNNITVNNPLNTEDHASQAFGEKFRWVQPLAEGAAEGAASALGYAAGAVLACYVVDGVATTLFPPAAALATLCPPIGGAFALKQGAEKGVTKAATKGLEKAAIRAIASRAY